MTSDQLALAWDVPVLRAAIWAQPMTDAITKFSIYRQAMFVAQVGHESGCGRYVKEIWGPTPAQNRYEGRVDLGNTESGDGFKYRGRGLIQITGRANYKLCGLALEMDLVNRPELLEVPIHAASSAAWFWQHNRLDTYAPDDAGFVAVTRRINGGLNGIEDRRRLWALAKQVFH